MFPITHIYCIKKLQEKRTPLMYLGSIFPDILVAGILTRELTHMDGKEIYNFFKEKHPEQIDFAIGMISHGVEPKGIDYYCDYDPEPRDGYAFKKSEPLINALQEASGLSPMLSLVRSHNFIELAIEYLLVQDDKELSSDLLAAEQSAYQKSLLSALSEHFNITEQELIDAFKSYFTTIVIPKDIETTVKGLQHIFIIKDKIEIDYNKLRKIFEDAILIIKDEYKSALDEMIKKTRPILAHYKE